MQIGFVNFNTEEKKKVAKMMQLLQESEAIEELGIGRVRDYFSNTLFPGTSTLQHHAKYFAVLPSLYYDAAYKAKKFQNIYEVDRYIKEGEIHLTRQLAKWDGNNVNTTATGITGINTLKDALVDYRKYVKYDPSYIYGTGLATYGIIPDTSIERLVLELNRKHYNNPHTKSFSRSEDLTGDSDDMSNEKQYIKHCLEKYNIFGGTEMELSLSTEEASFLSHQICSSCEGTLLSFLIEGITQLPTDTKYYELEPLLDGLSPNVLDIYKKSVLFSKLIHQIDWRFNYSYFTSFGKTDLAEQCNDKYEKFFAEYAADLSNTSAYKSLFEYILSKDPMLTDFCESCYHAIINRQPERVDELVKARERVVKRDRSKIGNSAYRDQNRGIPQPNTFRWDTVKTMVNEIRNPR